MKTPYNPNKKVALIDLDGTISEWRSWEENDLIPGNILSDARKALLKIGKYYNIIIFTNRATDEIRTLAVENWLDENDILYVKVTAQKCRAHILIDNIAISFKGNWEETVEEVLIFNN